MHRLTPILMTLLPALPASALATPPQVPAPSAPAAEVRVLLEALDDERRAEAFYAAVIARHGEVRPFSNIVQAERRHQALVEDALTERGVALPVNPHAGKAPAVPPTVGEACAEAARLEQENVKLYDRLLAEAKAPEVRDLLERLQWMSQERHLPAFERCGGGSCGR